MDSRAKKTKANDDKRKLQAYICTIQAYTAQESNSIDPIYPSEYLNKLTYLTSDQVLANSETLVEANVFSSAFLPLTSCACEKSSQRL